MTKQKTILCIEDNISSAELFRRMLSTEDYDVQVAATGGRAIDFVRENKVDLVLCDINLPGMTGFDVLVQLKKLPNGAGIPIIAVTANPVTSSKEACLDAGFSAYINKPVMRNELTDLIAAFLSDTQV